MIEDKKIMIKELINETYSLLEEIYNEQKSGLKTEKEAQKEAILRIKDLRYGDQNKDYFWINDMYPKMIMHPYRPDLNGQDLTNYRDYKNKKLFVEFVKVVKEQNDGFVNYMWQWEDVPDRIVPKLSYVKGFKPWGWIIGTGIYIEDVRKRIFNITQNLIITTLLILFIISIILFINIKTFIKIEKLRTVAEQNLIETKEKYKTLVEASNDAILMIVNKKIIYLNNFFLNLSGYSENEIYNINLEKLISDYNKIEKTAEENLNYKIESEILSKEGNKIKGVFHLSHFSINQEDGIILIIKDLLTEKKLSDYKIDEIKDNIISELQTSQFFLYQNVSIFEYHNLKCNLNAPIIKVIKLMKKNIYGACLIVSDNNQFIGIITDSDVRERLFNNDININLPAYNIMTSPVYYIYENATVYEALNIMQTNNVMYLAVKSTNDDVLGIIDINELLRNQSYSSTIIINNINHASSVIELIESYQKLPYLVKSLADSGIKARSILRLLSNISDNIIKRVIELGIEKLGTPPVSFSFIVFGSMAREEQTLFTDQDNAIIYENVPDKKKKNIKKYFLNLGEFITSSLNEIGIRYCPANIMANNPSMNQQLNDWTKSFQGWISELTPNDLLSFNILFDFRLIYGSSDLADNLKESIHNFIKTKQNFIKNIAANALLTKVPIDIFGKLVYTHNKEDRFDKLDIKSLMLPLINTIRVLSLYFNIKESNTLSRLKKLFELGILVKTDYIELEEAFDFIMILRLKEEIKNIKTADENSLFVNPKDMTGLEITILKKSLNQISLFQTKLNYYFNL